MTLFSRASINDQSTTKPHSRGEAKADSGERHTTRLAADDDGTATHLRVLGLGPDATWDEITDAHARLVADLTPGPNASHRNVSLAEQFLSEVNQAFASLSMKSVA